jgi:hypothetical protein
MQWLMRRGIVADRAVDFSKLQPLCAKASAKAQRLAIWVWQQWLHLVAWAKRQF